MGLADLILNVLQCYYSASSLLLPCCLTIPKAVPLNTLSKNSHLQSYSIKWERRWIQEGGGGLFLKSHIPEVTWSYKVTREATKYSLYFGNLGDHLRVEGSITTEEWENTNLFFLPYAPTPLTWQILPWYQNLQGHWGKIYTKNPLKIYQPESSNE